MARRERLCPEITDPQLRGFLDMLPDLRAYNTGLVLSQKRFAETTEFSLPGRKKLYHARKRIASGKAPRASGGKGVKISLPRVGIFAF